MPEPCTNGICYNDIFTMDDRRAIERALEKAREGAETSFECQAIVELLEPLLRSERKG